MVHPEVEIHIFAVLQAVTNIEYLVFLAYDPGIYFEQDVEVVRQVVVPITEPDEFKVLKVNVPPFGSPHLETLAVAKPPR